MSLLLFLLFGLIVGLLARALLPGNHGMGLLMTALLGAAGSFMGGFLTSLVDGTSPLTLHKTGLIGSVIGAMAVLAIAGFVRKKHSD